jgi:hypothetical protein
MSLVDDARRLAETCPSETDRGGRGECYYCSGGNYEGDYSDQTPTLADFRHQPDCPWLSMPKIVAALEVAEQLCHHMLLEEVWPARQALARIMLGADEHKQPRQEMETGGAVC